ncbi:AAA family ATPase [Nocardia terpenica]|uniref:AAA family ATPase n=1 Tax=Nocardia terpenica TaxID=455432 RepID=UPI001EE9C961|nr:AAA family ATPase [Nocardia terpenica]
MSETRSEPDRGGRFGAVYVITGVQAAGKSTVAQALAERLPRSAHISGDTFRRFMVGGRVEMSPDPSPEALRQLRLRYRLAARSADEYAGAGFTAIVQDVILGPELSYLIDRIHTRPLYVVVLSPAPKSSSNESPPAPKPPTAPTPSPTSTRSSARTPRTSACGSTLRISPSRRRWTASSPPAPYTAEPSAASSRRPFTPSPACRPARRSGVPSLS